MLRSKGLAVSSFTMLALAVLAACSAGGTPNPGGDGTGDNRPGEVESLTIGLAAPNQVYWAVYVADAKGFFGKEGFKADFVTTGGSAASVEQLAAGSVDLGAATPDAFVNGIAAGAQVRMSAVTVTSSPLRLVAQKSIKSISELRGKTIGVSALKGGEIGLLESLLDAKGLSKNDYTVVVSGTTPAKAAALASGTIQAAVLFSPTEYVMEQKGYNILASLTEVPLGKQIPLAVYGTQNEWQRRTNHEARLHRALQAANKWLLDPNNKKEACEIYEKVSKQPLAAIEKTYDFWFQEEKVWPESEYLTSGQVEATIALMKDIGLMSSDKKLNPMDYYVPAP